MDQVTHSVIEKKNWTIKYVYGVRNAAHRQWRRGVDVIQRRLLYGCRRKPQTDKTNG